MILLSDIVKCFILVFLTVLRILRVTHVTAEVALDLSKIRFVHPILIDPFCMPIFHLNGEE